MKKIELINLIKECVNEVLNETYGYYHDKMEYIVNPRFKLHALDVDEDRGHIELEFTYNDTGDTYSILYNHFNNKMDVGVSVKGDKNYKTISSDEFRKSDYHDPVYTTVELELDNLSRFINEEPDDPDYEDDEDRLGKHNYPKNQSN